MEIVLSSASHHAMLIAYVAKEVEDAFGEKGRNVVIEAIREYGRQRGRRMAMRALVDGMPCNALSYALYSEWDCFPGQTEKRFFEKDGVLHISYSRCPWYTEWKQFGMLKYGSCYCRYVDMALFEGFGITDGELVSCRTEGSATCDLVFRDSHYTREDFEKMQAHKLRLEKRAVMPWEYHMGHLYQSFHRCIEEAFGLRGHRCLQRAMRAYAREFGEDAKAKVLEYAQGEYEELPDYTCLPSDTRDFRWVDRVVKTDVLVAGGSGAAVTAAVEASRQGMQVLMVSKGKVADSGNLLMAGGGFGIDGHSARHELGIREADDFFGKKDMEDCLLKEGFYLSDRDLLDLYVEEGPAAAKEFIQWGKEAGQDYFFAPNGTWIASGKSFARALEEGMHQHPEIRRMEDSVLLDLIVQDGRAIGGIALDLYRGELVLIQTKAVVLATGGYQPFGRNNTVSDMTGDGQAMAYRAGAELVDMEFILGMPTALEPAEMKGSIYPFVFEFNMPDLKYRFLDREGKEVIIPQKIVDRFRGKKISKLVNSYYFAKAAEQGRLSERGGLYLDYSENTVEERKADLEGFYDRFARWHRRGWYNGEDLEQVEKAILEGRPLEVMLGYEYAMGGIQVQADMSTSVKGLFAAGEVTGGTFGACRAGDGMLEMLCQGRKAGETAAKFCRGKEHKTVDVEQLSRTLRRQQRFFAREKGISPNMLLRQIREVCDRGFGVLRDGKGLGDTLEALLELRRQLEEESAIHSEERLYNMEWLNALQCENLLICCEAGVRAALERKESRGCHMRADYPEVDHEAYWVKYVLRQKDGHMELTSRKPRGAGIRPKGKRESIMAYLTDPELDYRR